MQRKTLTKSKSSLRASFACVANQFLYIKDFSRLLDRKTPRKDNKINNSLYRAFTLVELAIVLVIIGLLTAGVVGGQSLIESSKRTKMIKEISNYQTSIRAFQLEYNGYPGDFKDAEQYWGTAAACPTGGAQGSGTCKGDGDKKLLENTEAKFVPQQLALAGLMKGSYNSNWSTGAYAETNYYKLPYEELMMTFHWIGSLTNFPIWYDGNYGNSLRIGKPINDNCPACSSNPAYTNQPLSTTGFHCIAIKSIDEKIDDGEPALGRVRTWRGLTCSTDDSYQAGSNADYKAIKNSSAVMLVTSGF